MIKFLHLIFILLSISSFIARVFFAHTNPTLLEQKWIKIGPHIINGLLLMTGGILVFQGSWLAAGQYGWIITKLIALLGYVGLGMVAIKNEGSLRWKAFAGAVACFIFIVAVAISKQPFLFF